MEMNSLDNIKEALIKACINSDSIYFKPYLVLEKVKCEPDKKSFYKLFKYMLAVSKKTSQGELFLKISLPNSEKKNIQHYEFFDTLHLHSRLTIIVEEFRDSIYLGILPF
jgi:glycogen debranching enzyme